MGYKCAAFGCKSGYRSQKSRQNTGEKITFHSYPLKDQILCAKWIHANPRKDFVPSKYSRLCSLHFTSGDFVEMHSDSNAQRRLKYPTAALRKRYLKKDAVPSIFPNTGLPTAKSRKSSRLPPCRREAVSTENTTSSRSQKSKTLQNLSDSVEDDLTFTSLEEIHDRLLSKGDLPDGFEMKIFDERLLIYRLGVEDELPKIKACITVKNDHTRSLSLDGKLIDDMIFDDLVPYVFQTMSQIYDTLVLIKAWCEPSDKIDISVINCFKDDIDNLTFNMKKE